MSDLDKLMKKLNKGEAKIEEVPTPTPQAPTPDVETPQEPTEDEMDDIVSVDQTPKEEEKVEEVEPQEAEEPQADQHDQLVNSEVALFQNDGIFRRELLLTLKEFVDVHKVQTQTLIDIKKKLYGEDGKAE